MDTSNVPLSGLAGAFPDLGVANYQRGTVWSGRQKAALIRSLLRDYPTGIVLLYKYKPTTGQGYAKVTTGSQGVFSHDIIDGQQRLNTVFEFMDNPLIYALEWVKKSPEDEDEAIIKMRDEFEKLVELMRTTDFRGSGKKKREIANEVRELARRELQFVNARAGIQDSRFQTLVDRMKDFLNSVSQRKFVVQELDNIDSDKTVEIYYLINTTGQDILWWEQLKTDDRFIADKYVSRGTYNTVHDLMVERLSGLYRGKGKIAARPTSHDTFWDSLFTVGEYYQLLLVGKNPQDAAQLVPRERQKLKVDGLGFRLASGCLTHDLRRVAAIMLRKSYPNGDKIREAIDLLMVTGNLLCAAPNACKFRLFSKYSAFEAEVVPSYPLLGLIIIASQMAKTNKDNGRGCTLTQNDGLNLRVLAEELFREVLCSEKWAGTGDQKLKDWLDEHVDDQGRISANSSYSRDEWIQYLDQLEPSGKRSAERKDMVLSYWAQYLFDAFIPESLPHGVVSFDHIVPFQDSVGSPTTHPLNIAATTFDLNRDKSKNSYLQWDPTGIQRDYVRHTLNGPVVASTSPAAPRLDFLAHADHANLPLMIEERHKIFKYAFETLLPQWTTAGD